MEILFYLGYRPELKARLDNAVQQEVDKYQRSKKEANGKALNGSANSKSDKTAG